MKRVALYGEDGFDLDVLTNQIHLYQSLGCSVVWAKTYIPCDLWVVLRGKKGHFLEIPQDQPCLFVDYTGHDVLDWYQTVTINHKRCITSQKNEENKALGIYFGHPYIDITSFARPLADLKFDFVHVGSYKLDTKRDLNSFDFIAELERTSCQIWGKFWDQVPLTKAHWLGALNPSKVSETYAQSRIALGCKYSHQLEKAISGRYWQAPLNGCALWVDDDYLNGEIPGTFSYGTYEIPVRESIQQMATHYWQQQNELQRSLSLELLAQPRTKEFSVLRWIYHKVEGMAYRHYRLFTYR